MKRHVVSQRETSLDASALSPSDGDGAAHGIAAQGEILCHVRSLSVLQDVSAPRWKHGERLKDVLEEACRKFADRVAVSTEAGDYTFHELDARANQMARYFAAQGIKAGDRVGILFDRGFEAYAALFGLLKVRATYVPLDANHPADRVAYTLSDAAATRVVTQAGCADRFVESALPTIELDTACEDIRALDASPPSKTAPPWPTTRFATSSTLPAPRAGRKVSPSRIGASAILCASPRNSTGSVRATGSIRACRLPSTSPSKSFGFRWWRARRWCPIRRPRPCSATNSPIFLKGAGSPAFAACPR